jgi:hypothetical protein
MTAKKSVGKIEAVFWQGGEWCPRPNNPFLSYEMFINSLSSFVSYLTNLRISNPDVEQVVSRFSVDEAQTMYQNLAAAISSHEIFVEKQLREYICDMAEEIVRVQGYVFYDEANTSELLNLIHFWLYTEMDEEETDENEELSHYEKCRCIGETHINLFRNNRY